MHAARRHTPFVSTQRAFLSWVALTMGMWSADILGSDDSLALAMRMLAAAGIVPADDEDFSMAGVIDKDHPASIWMLPCADPKGENVLALICRNAHLYGKWYKALNSLDNAADIVEARMAEMVAVANADNANACVKNRRIDACGGSTYNVLAVLIMHAGAAMDPSFQQVVLSEIEVDASACDPDDFARRFVMTQFWKLVKNYDVRGGCAVRYVQETIQDIQAYGASKYVCDNKRWTLEVGGYRIVTADGSEVFIEASRLDKNFFPMSVYRVKTGRRGNTSAARSNELGVTIDPQKPFVEQPSVLQFFRRILGARNSDASPEQLVSQMRVLAAIDPGRVPVGLEGLLKEDAIKTIRNPPSEGTPTGGDAVRASDAEPSDVRAVRGHLKALLKGSSGVNPNQICHHCRTWRGAHNISTLKLQKCSGCQQVFYCSKKCQRADWKDHKVVCRRAAAQQQSPRAMLVPRAGPAGS